MDEYPNVPVIQKIFPATPLQAWDKLQEMLAAAGERINLFADASPIEETYYADQEVARYVGYCIRQVIEGFFGLDVHSPEWMQPNAEMFAQAARERQQELEEMWRGTHAPGSVPPWLSRKDWEGSED